MYKLEKFVCDDVLSIVANYVSDRDMGRYGLEELVKHKWCVDMNSVMGGACLRGHIETVELLISKGADDWDDGLWNACEGGHREIVELMISKGANDWNWGLVGACEGGHIEIVELMISKGGDECRVCNNRKHSSLPNLR